MSHFGRSGPPAIRDTFSLLVLNVSFRTTADDLFPLFDRYGDVVDIYIPRDRRTGDSRGFAFVRYKYEDEAQKAVTSLMAGQWMEGTSWCSSPSTAPMLKGFKRGGLWKKFRSQGVVPEAAVQDGGIEMIIGTETIEGEAGAEAQKDMNETGPEI